MPSSDDNHHGLMPSDPDSDEITPTRPLTDSERRHGGQDNGGQLARLKRRTAPQVAARMDPDEVTPVLDLASPDDAPVTAGHLRDAFAQLAGSLSSLRRRSDTGEQERSAQLEQILARAPDLAILGSLQADVLALKQGLARVETASNGQADGVRDSTRDLKLIKWVAGVAITFALSSVLVVLFRLLDSAKLDGETTIKIDHVERRLDRIEQLMIFNFRSPPPKDSP